MAGQTKVFVHRNYSPSAGELPPENHWAFTVANVDVACQDLQAKGLQIEIAAHDYD